MRRPDPTRSPTLAAYALGCVLVGLVMAALGALLGQPAGAFFVMGALVAALNYSTAGRRRR